MDGVCRAYVDQSELQGQLRRITIAEGQLGESGHKPVLTADFSTEEQIRERVYQVLDRALLKMRSADSGR